MLAVLAVMLCTAMVLIVWSVMGGFLSMLLGSGRQMVGDVTLAWPIVGIGYYDEFIDDLEAHPSVSRATPTIEALGLLQLPGGEIRQVQVIGVDPNGYDAVTGYYDRVYWAPLDEPLADDDLKDDPRYDGDRTPATLLALKDAKDALKAHSTAEFRERLTAVEDDRLASLRPLTGDDAVSQRRAVNERALRNAADIVFEAQIAIEESVGAEGEVDTAAAARIQALTDVWFDLRSRIDRTAFDGRLADRIQNFADAGRSLRMPLPGETEPVAAIVPGTEVARYSTRTKAGYLVPTYGFLPSQDTVTISVLPLNKQGGAVNTDSREFPVANEFRTGLFQVDANWVIMPIEVLQDMLRLDAKSIRDPNWVPGIEIVDGVPKATTPTIVGTEPARATNILIGAVEGVSPDELEVVVREVYAAFHERKMEDPEVVFSAVPEPRRVQVYTWERKPGLAQFVAAVKKEIVLVLALFGIISLTAVVLILSIFWAMVSEKTKDIGVLRAIGASRAGIAWLFLRYGLSIGVVGSLLGGALAVLVVSNINPIHTWLGEALGLVIWDPSVYYFSRIPSEIDPTRTALVLSAGVLSSVIGALIPAVRAAWMDPVRALRFE